MTRMTGPDCAVMCKLINTHTHTHTHTHKTSNHSRKTRRPSDTVASCGGPEPRDGRRGTGSGRSEEGRRRKPQKSDRRDMGNGGDLGGKRKKRRQ